MVFAAIVELDRRQTQPLFPNRFGRRVVAGHTGAAEIRLVPFGHRPESEPFLVKHRARDGNVGKVAVTLVRIIRDDHVAGMKLLVLIFAADRLHRERDRAEQHGNIGSLGNQLRLGIEDRGNEVARLAEDRRARREQHDLPHLLGDRSKPIGDDRHRDGINGWRGHRYVQFRSHDESFPTRRNLSQASTNKHVISNYDRLIVSSAARRLAQFANGSNVYRCRARLIFSISLLFPCLPVSLSPLLRSPICHSLFSAIYR